MDIPIYIMAGLASFGYFLNKDGKVNRESEPIKLSSSRSENKEPNSINPYEQKRFKKVKKMVEEKANEIWENSNDPLTSNVIPQNFNRDSTDMYSPIQNNNNNNNGSPIKQRTLTNEEFTHNNMVPFFGGSIKQNTNIEQNTNTLELFTGGPGLKPPKHEVENMFKPEKNVGNVFGTQLAREDDRYIPSITRDGEKPFQPIRVAPGLNQGPTSVGSIGFHDDYRVLEKTVDELRVKKKMTYEGRINPPKRPVQDRGKIGTVEKNLPETFYEKTIGHLFKTIGAYTKEKKRPEVLLKATNRKKTKSYTGIAGPSTEEKHESRPNVQKDRKNTYCGPGFRNLSAGQKWKVKKNVPANRDTSDYGKGSFRSYPNERQVSGCKTHATNVRSLIKRRTAPLDDRARVTRKQQYVTYNRRGNVRIPSTKSHTVPHLQNAKTTIKETLIHDTRTGTMAPQRPQQLRTYDPSSKARTTIRETTENFSVRSNLKGKGTKSHRVYQYLDKPRTTIKETTVHDTRTGSVQAPKKSSANSYNPKEWRFRTTHREVNPHAKWGCCPFPKPHLRGENKMTVYDPTDVTRTTMKETTIENQRNGNLTGKSGLTKHTVYDPTDYAKTTMKETTAETKSIGGVGASVLQQGKGYITANASATAPNTNRQFTSDIQYYGISDGDNNGGGTGYLTNPKEAPNTNRQFTSDIEYTGTAISDTKQQMSYEDMYNAEMNALKEKIAEGREPTLSNVKVSVGGDKVNLVPAKKISQQENTTALAPTRVYSNTPETNNCNNTKIPNKDDEDNISNRINPELLKAFKENPFTQSLNSF